MPSLTFGVAFCGRMILHENVKSSTNGAWRQKYLLGPHSPQRWMERTYSYFFSSILRIFSGGTGSVKFALRVVHEKKGHKVVLYVRSLSQRVYE